jgi:hypothetical protein
VGGRTTGVSQCRSVPTGRDFAVRGPVSISVAAGARPAPVRLRRLAGAFGPTLGSISPMEAGTLQIPADRSRIPWHVLVDGSDASLSVCAGAQP